MTEPYEPGASHLDRLWPPSAPMTHTASIESLWHWLASTRMLQRAAFGVDYDKLEGDELANYVSWNVTALTAELGEFLAEVGWKPWAKPRGWMNRDQAVGELVDVGHFLANLLCALGVTDEEWEERYRAKQQVNRDRQAVGYDGRSTKCQCGRALEDGTPTQDYDLESYTTVPGRRCICGKFHPRA